MVILNAMNGRQNLTKALLYTTWLHGLFNLVTKNDKKALGLRGS